MRWVFSDGSSEKTSSYFGAVDIATAIVGDKEKPNPNFTVARSFLSEIAKSQELSLGAPRGRDPTWANLDGFLAEHNLKASAVSAQFQKPELYSVKLVAIQYALAWFRNQQRKQKPNRLEDFIWLPLIPFFLILKNALLRKP